MLVERLDRLEQRTHTIYQNQIRLQNSASLPLVERSKLIAIPDFEEAGAVASFLERIAASIVSEPIASASNPIAQGGRGLAASKQNTDKEVKWIAVYKDSDGALAPTWSFHESADDAHDYESEDYVGAVAVNLRALIRPRCRT